MRRLGRRKSSKTSWSRPTGTATALTFADEICRTKRDGGAQARLILNSFMFVCRTLTRGKTFIFRNPSYVQMEAYAMQETGS